MWGIFRKAFQCSFITYQCNCAIPCIWAGFICSYTCIHSTCRILNACWSKYQWPEVIQSCSFTIRNRGSIFVKLNWWPWHSYRWTSARQVIFIAKQDISKEKCFIPWIFSSDLKCCRIFLICWWLSSHQVFLGPFTLCL